MAMTKTRDIGNIDKSAPDFKSCSKISRGKRSTFSSLKSGASPKPQAVYIKTFGCQMNVRDSEVIAGLLRAKSYELTADPADADVVIFNTCSVRQHAEDKVWSEIGRIAKSPAAYGMRRTAQKSERAVRGTRYAVRNQRPLIGLVGCMAQTHQDRVFERSTEVDFIVGPSDIAKIPGIIASLLEDRQGMFEKKIWETDGKERPEEIYHTGYHEDKKHAYIVISEGCSNFCSYCVVPFARGPLRNRSHEGIIREIGSALEKGITSITLLGQNVNAYSSPQPSVRLGNLGVGFIQLLSMVNGMKGLKEFSFITSHPKDTSPELFKAIAGLDKLKKYLHLPVQSGSDRILQLMNRGYTRRFYLDLAADFRKMVKNGTLTTDIIVGFPTETEEDLQDTLNLVKGIEFDAGFIFKYSPRPHTAAAQLADTVNRQEKERRHALILELQRKISKRKAAESRIKSNPKA